MGTEAVEEDMIGKHWAEDMEIHKAEWCKTIPIAEPM